VAQGWADTALHYVYVGRIIMADFDLNKMVYCSASLLKVFVS